ncbi:1-acyl-sn-glycerol-3-phosphate acyltransferase [bacterium BMS3Bbin07]|nr:1-acyl-sn-glycerol-3-phosphate acyltransferase [bacterium BMS3Bbin07]
MYWIFRAVLKIVYKLLFCFEVRGAENIPAEGEVIIAANHLSHLDPPLIGVCIKRRAVFMAKSSLFHVPVIGWFVRRLSIPVDRDTARPSTIKEAVRQLKEGRVLVMFPEGTRSRDGDVGGGKRGVAMIAALSHARVVPALIEGTERALPAGAGFLRPTKVRVTFGRPIEYSGAETSKSFQQRITGEIMDRIRELKQEPVMRNSNL